MKVCGIAGIVNFDGAPVRASDLQAMIATLTHRGPDGHGIWTSGSAGLGHRRLSIRDLSDSGSQPMITPDAAVAVTFNGEIYNDRAIRATLTRAAGTSFRTHCDTEVIGPAWQHWGIDAFRQLEGIFAIGLWDASSKKLVLARDPVGVKPIYVSRIGASFRFASEIKALLALPDQRRVLDPESIHRFLAQGFPGPDRTLIDGISPVPPGSVLIVDAAGAETRRLWEPTRRPTVTRLKEAVERFVPLWRTVVGEQLVSDIPVGLLLSGGIDSALVATALSRGSSLRAFTARFGDSSFDEHRIAQIAAGQAGLDHRQVVIDGDAEMESRFRSVVHHVDGQLSDSSSLAFFSLCRAARPHVSVLLTGDGADEFFGGYETYRASRMAAVLSPFLPARLARSLSRWLFARAARHEGRTGATEKVARFLAGIAHGRGVPHAQWRRHLYPEEAATLYGQGMSGVERDALADYAAALTSSKGGLVDRCLIGDQTYYLPGDLLVKTDAMSMAHGIEARVPFLDRRIMEFAGTLHPRLLTPIEGPDKRVLRAALSALGLPSALTRAPKKGFNVPVASYLRTGLRRLGTELLDRDADCLMPFLDSGAVRELWRAHIDRRADHGYILWTMLTFAVWRTSAGV